MGFGHVRDVLHDSFLRRPLFGPVLVLVEGSRVPEHHAARRNVHHSLSIRHGDNVIRINLLPGLRRVPSALRLEVCVVDLVRSLIEDQGRAAVAGQSYDPLYALKPLLGRRLVRVRPDRVALSETLPNEAASVERDV